MKSQDYRASLGKGSLDHLDPVVVRKRDDQRFASGIQIWMSDASVDESAINGLGLENLDIRRPRTLRFCGGAQEHGAATDAFSRVSLKAYTSNITGLQKTYQGEQRCNT